MPKTAEESLLGDHSDQWIDADCPEAKRLKVRLLYLVIIVPKHEASVACLIPTWQRFSMFYSCFVACSRAQVEEPSMMSDSEDAVDSRQWTQHHLAAADIRVPPSMALTPPQGEYDSDCMDVNVRGPGQHYPYITFFFFSFKSNLLRRSFPVIKSVH